MLTVKILAIANRKTTLTAEEKTFLHKIALILGSYNLDNEKDLEHACKIWVAMREYLKKEKA